jgi:hypothetical protein
MTPTQDQARDQFQRQLDAAGGDDTLVLDPPLERTGPVVVRKPLTLDGRGGAIWGWTGPVVRVTAPHVTLRNLRIEYTADQPDEGPNAGVALRVEADHLTLENVTVRGTVVGLAAEAGEWRYPHQLNLGAVAHRVPHSLRVRMAVPVPCQLTSEIAGVKLHPSSLTPGAHEVRVQLDPLMADTLLFGTIAIKTAFLRREIVLNAHVLAPVEGLPAPSADPDRIVWQPADWDALLAGGVPLAPPPTSMPVSPPPVPEPEPIRLAPVVSVQPGPSVPVAKPVSGRGGPVITLTPDDTPATASLPPAPTVSLTPDTPTPPQPPPVVSRVTPSPPPPPPPPNVTPPVISPPVRSTKLKSVSGPLLGGAFGNPPGSTPVSPPPSAPGAGMKQVSGPLLGGAFAPPPPAVAPPPPPPPPVVPPPPPPPADPVIPADVLEEAKPKSSIRLKPKSGLFGSPPPPEASPPPPPPAPEPPPPPKRKFRPAGGLPGWIPPPPPAPEPPPPAG